MVLAAGGHNEIRGPKDVAAATAAAFAVASFGVDAPSACSAVQKNARENFDGP